MSCKTLKLKNCEIKGATFQGRRFDFVNKVITNDTFKAKVYNSEGVLKTEITGLKSGSVVYFPFTTLETYDKGNYTIRYWAEFHLLGKFNIADEDFKIANSCPKCTTQNQPYPFVLDLGEDIVKFNMSFVYIQIGSGGDIDLTAYLTKEEAAETYQPKGNYASENHNHSDKANTDASNISEENTELWRKKLNVPEKQDEVISKGEVTADSSTVYLALHPSGKNEVLIAGQSYFRTEAQSFPFTPVTTGEKILIIHALPDAQVFHLAQGAESTEAVEPAYSGLFVARILVSSAGQVIEESTEDDDFKLKAESGWRNVIATNINQAIQMVGTAGTSFNVKVAAGSTDPKIGGLATKLSKNVYPGMEIMFRIDSDTPVTFTAGTYTQNGMATSIGFKENYIGAANSVVRFFWNEDNVFELMQSGASFPTGNTGDVLVKTATGEEFSPRLTNAEAAITAINTRTSSVVDKMLHYWNTATQKWISSGVEFISAGIIKVKSVILTTNSGTALPDELGYDGTNVFFGNTKRKLAFKDEIFEHNVRGKRVEATISGTYAIDLNAGSHFSLTATTATTISFSNMILADETCAISMTVTGQLLTMPAWLIRDAYSDIPDAAKTREYTIIIKKGGVSPSGRFNVINM